MTFLFQIEIEYHASGVTDRTTEVTEVEVTKEVRDDISYKAAA